METDDNEESRLPGIGDTRHTDMSEHTLIPPNSRYEAITPSYDNMMPPNMEQNLTTVSHGINNDPNGGNEERLRHQHLESVPQYMGAGACNVECMKHVNHEVGNMESLGNLKNVPQNVTKISESVETLESNIDGMSKTFSHANVMDVREIANMTPRLETFEIVSPASLERYAQHSCKPAPPSDERIENSPTQDIHINVHSGGMAKGDNSYQPRTGEIAKGDNSYQPIITSQVDPVNSDEIAGNVDRQSDENSTASNSSAVDETFQSPDTSRTDNSATQRTDNSATQRTDNSATPSLSESNYERDISTDRDNDKDEIADFSFSAKVDEIVNNLGQKRDEGETSNISKEHEESEDSTSNLATKFVHIIDDHSENFRHQLHEQWLKGQYCDLVIKLKDSEVKVHSCVLAAFSPVLGHLKKNQKLILQEVDYAAVVPIIKMIYTGILCCELSEAPDIVLAAKYLMLDDVAAVCQNYISQCIKSGLSVGKTLVTVKKTDFEQQIEKQNVHLPCTTRKRGRAKGKLKKKRGRPPRQRKVKEEEIRIGETEEDDKNETEYSAEQKVVDSSRVDKDEDDEENDMDENIEDMDEDVDEDEHDEYEPDEDEKMTYGTRQRLWPHRKRRWLMGRLKDKTKPKHTKRDNAGRLKCPGCEASFSSSEELQNHIENSAEHNAFRCTQCGVAYIRKSNLTRHMRTVHSSSFHLKCRQCNISTKTERELRNHCLQAHDNSNPFECEEPGCNYRTYKYDFLRRHKQIHNEAKEYICDKCGKSFSQQAGLLSHHRTCYHLQEYLCDVCGQAFNHYQSMKSHRRSIHYGERPFMCSDCGTRFSDHRNLKRHRRIHENVFPYACQICGQKYRHSNSLKAHMKKHSDLMSTEAATSALINTYSTGEVEIGSQFAHPTPISLPSMPLHQLHEYYTNTCDKFVTLTPSSIPQPPMSLAANQMPSNSAGTSVGLDTLADLCLSSSVV